MTSAGGWGGVTPYSGPSAPNTKHKAVAVGVGPLYRRPKNPVAHMPCDASSPPH